MNIDWDQEFLDWIDQEGGIESYIIGYGGKVPTELEYAKNVLIQASNQFRRIFEAGNIERGLEY